MNKPKILVVDNDKDMCWLIASILKEEGLGVDIAHDVKSALTKINRHQYQVMVLDYKLSGMSGLTVLEKVHQIKSSIVTIMISAFGSESVRAKAKEFGAYAFLDKPFNINRLKRSVKKALAEQKRRCVNETNGNSKCSRSTSGEHCGSSGFGSTGASSDSSFNSSKDRHPVHIGAS
jgi:DNA-binding NtrC family response regulator